MEFPIYRHLQIWIVYGYILYTLCSEKNTHSQFLSYLHE